MLSGLKFHAEYHISTELEPFISTLAAVLNPVKKLQTPYAINSLNGWKIASKIATTI
jgi:hypothetical protein